MPVLTRDQHIKLDKLSKLLELEFACVKKRICQSLKSLEYLIK